jgi:ketosteroid isomerase-like protein
MKKLIIYLFVLFISVPAFSQRNNGNVNSLITTESYLNDLFNTKGIDNAYKKVTKKNTMFYVPQPVNAKEYYKDNKITNQVLTKTPDYAILSKSASYGITSGVLTTQKEQSITYNRYLTIWKSSKDGKWGIELNAISPQPQPQPNIEVKQLFINPENRDYPRIYGPPYLQLREQVIFNTDSLLGHALKKAGNSAFKNYYADDVQLFLPNQTPVIGKVNVLNKIAENNLLYTNKPAKVKRASSGDIAYTTGTATIGLESYDYIRVWQKDGEMKWNIIIDMYVNEK